MKLLTEAIKGTKDILPKEAYKWNFIKNKMNSVANLYGFNEIRTPVFEHTELFSRSVGEATDVVQKEMYTFLDKGGRSITLRPEGTAGVVRSILESGLYNEGFPLKVNYNLSCYRYEKPQAGRYREFHQFGAEIFGTSEPSSDAELIVLANDIFKTLQIQNLSLEINSIGCPSCRKKYYESLKKYFELHKDELCDTCIDRINKNPMRILDCKNLDCINISKNAPVILDYICEECKNHFERVKSFLDDSKINYKVNPKIVRGLDYYTKTVFEFISTEIGAQGAVGGGGRYDGLVEELGGPSIPALGFGLGVERIMLLIEKQKIRIPKINTCSLYIANIGEKAHKKAFELIKIARSFSLICECDIVGRNLKSQMKYANKIGAKFSMVIGDEEIEKNKGTLKNMSTGEIFEVSLNKETFGAEVMKFDLEVNFNEK